MYRRNMLWTFPTNRDVVGRYTGKVTDLLDNGK